MRLFLHIGAAKCGSTSIQHFISANNSQLIQAGVMPMTVWGRSDHWKLPVATRSTQVKEYWIEKHNFLTVSDLEHIADSLWDETEQFVELATKSGVSSFVGSSERLYTQVRSREDIEYLSSKLRQIFSEIFLVFYCRDQGELARSIWAQLVKGPARETISLKRYCESLDSTRTLNYYLYVSKWADVFGSDTVKANTLAEKNLFRGDLISDFISCMGLSEMNFVIPTTKSNISPGYVTLELLRKKNQLTGFLPKSTRKWFDKSFSPLTRRVQAKDASRIPQDWDNLVREVFRSSNSEFNKTFLNDSPVKLPE